MSIQFNDTSTYKGLVQLYEKEIGVDYGTISGNATKLKSLTADMNLAVDDFLDLAINNSGTWKPDDSAHTDFPEITTPLVSGRRDYTFLTDELGNQILDIYKVYCRISSTGPYQLLTPVDPDREDLGGFTDGQNTTGVPTEYDKTGNVILLNAIPNYASSDGLKVSISREALYFTSGDTDKKPGFYGLYHKYFYLKPALDYARRNNLKNQANIERQVLLLEEKIKAGTALRTKDETPQITMSPINFL